MGRPGGPIAFPVFTFNQGSMMPTIDLSTDELESLIYWHSCLDPNHGDFGDDDYLPFAILLRKLEVSAKKDTTNTDSYIAELKAYKNNSD